MLDFNSTSKIIVSMLCFMVLIPNQLIQLGKLRFDIIASLSLIFTKMTIELWSSFSPTSGQYLQLSVIFIGKTRTLGMHM